MRAIALAILTWAFIYDYHHGREKDGAALLIVLSVVAAVACIIAGV